MPVLGAARGGLPQLGISHDYQLALIDVLTDLIDTAHLDSDVARRALWLKHGLQGGCTAGELRGAQDISRPPDLPEGCCP